jgi:hypothetical protein
MTGEAEARIDREVRAKSIDGRTPYQVALARIAKAEQGRDAEAKLAARLRRLHYEESKRAQAAEAQVRDLREALRLIADGYWATNGYEPGVTGARQCARRALQATQEDQ